MRLSSDDGAAAAVGERVGVDRRCGTWILRKRCTKVAARSGMRSFPPALDLRYRLGLGNLRRSVSGQTLFADLFEKVTRFPSLVMDREQTGNFLGFLIRQSAPWSIASRLWHTITNRIGSWRDETRSHSPDIRSRRGRYAVENTLIGVGDVAPHAAIPVERHL
jgi:hypothetical protein